MAKTRTRRKSGRFTSRAATAIVVAAPRRAPARRRAPQRISVRRRRSVGGIGGGGGASVLLRKSLFAAGLGMAQHAGYLARVPTFLQLGAEGSLAVLCYAGRRYLGGPVWLMDIAEVAAVVAANQFGQTVSLGNRSVSGIGADPYAVEGDEIGADPYAVEGDDE